MVLIEIDKSGTDFFKKGYAIAIVKDRKEVYGYRVSQELTDKLLNLFKKNELGIDSSKFSKNKQRVKLKVRAHAACIILVIKQIIKDYGFFDNMIINMCNDIDGHFADIKSMLYSHLIYDLPNIDPKQDITPQFFPKKSLVNVAAKNIGEHNKESSFYNLPKLDIKELIKIIKKSR